jgi:hypothetical protein
MRISLRASHSLGDETAIDKNGPQAGSISLPEHEQLVSGCLFRWKLTLRNGPGGKMSSEGPASITVKASTRADQLVSCAGDWFGRRFPRGRRLPDGAPCITVTVLLLKGERRQLLSGGSSFPRCDATERGWKARRHPLGWRCTAEIDLGLHESQVRGGEFGKGGEDGVEAARGNPEPGGQGGGVLRRGNGWHPASVDV